MAVGGCIEGDEMVSSVVVMVVVVVLVMYDNGCNKLGLVGVIVHGSLW